MSELVEISNLTKVYDKKMLALDHISLTIPRGKIVGLLGPNGSGKTTLIKLLNGLLVAQEGEILINGMKPGAETKGIVSYLPERTYFRNSMKVNELIDFFETFYADFRRDRAITMLDNLNIETEFGKCYPESIKRNQRKGTADYGYEQRCTTVCFR